MITRYSLLRGINTTYPGAEFGVATGRYYVDIPGTLAIGNYDVLANSNDTYYGKEHINWDGNNIIDKEKVISNAVWSQDSISYVVPGTMGYIQNQILAIESLVTLLLKYERNRTRVDKNAFTLTVYDDNGTTPLKVFNLKDFTGASSYTEIAEREPT